MQAKTSPENRRCKYPGCNNLISIYNHEEYCNVHLKATFWKDKVDGVPIDQTDDDDTKVMDVFGANY